MFQAIDSNIIRYKRLGEVMNYRQIILLSICLLAFGSSAFATAGIDKPADGSGELQNTVRRLNRRVTRMDRDLAKCLKAIKQLQADNAKLRQENKDLRMACRQPNVKSFYAKLRALLAKRDVALRNIINKQNRGRPARGRGAKSIKR